jgi:predicted peroxiredoxin
MPKLLISGTYGPEDPARASLPFHMAKGAKEAGFDVGIALANNGPYVMQDGLRETIVGVGLPPLKDLFLFAVSNKIPIYV